MLKNKKTRFNKLIVTLIKASKIFKTIIGVSCIPFFRKYFNICMISHEVTNSLIYPAILQKSSTYINKATYNFVSENHRLTYLGWFSKFIINEL